MIDLSPKSNWEIHAERETWVLVIKGHARVGPMNAFGDEAVFLKVHRTEMIVGPDGLRGLVAYLALAPAPHPSLLQDLNRRNAGSPARHSRAPLHHRARARSPVGSTGARP